MRRTRDKVFPCLSLHLCQFESLTVHQAVQEFYNTHGREHFHREHKLGMRLPVKCMLKVQPMQQMQQTLCVPECEKMAGGHDISGSDDEAIWEPDN